MVTHAVYRAKLALEAGRQLFSLMNSIINRRFTRFVFVFLRLRNAQRHGTDFVQTGLQCTIEQRIEFVQLTQRDLNGTYRTIAFKDAFTILVVVSPAGCAGLPR